MMIGKREVLPTIWKIPGDLRAGIHPVILDMDTPQATGRKRTRCHWNRLPRDPKDDSTIHRTFQRWVELGVLELICAVLIEE